MTATPDRSLERPYPPEMLPISPTGDANVVVCMGDCGNEPPCPLCAVIRPGDDPDEIMGADA